VTAFAAALVFNVTVAVVSACLVFTLPHEAG
jgi:hypothetical protein